MVMNPNAEQSLVNSVIARQRGGTAPEAPVEEAPVAETPAPVQAQPETPAVPEITRLLVHNNREITWINIGNHHYAYYNEPQYRDRLYIDDKSVNVDMTMEMVAPNQPPQPRFGGMTTIPRDFLVVVRALAQWTRPEPLSEDAIQDLPISVVETLEEVILEVEAWKKLGEAPAVLPSTPS